MQHRIPVDNANPHAEGMRRAVTTCVHCGFCLAACPTYKVMGEEMDSPRGRIVLMKDALEGQLSLHDVQPYIDRCLGCLACETACPSGVRYRDLLVPFRAQLESKSRATGPHQLRRTLLSTLESPARFRAAFAFARAARTAAPMLPARLRGLLDLLPRALPEQERLPAFVGATGPRRARVALLAGCVQQVLRPSINAATIRVLAANGVDVVIPQDQGCCGALALHSGFETRGHALADRNAAVFPADVDAIITNTAGCGSAMKEHAYRAPVRDVAEFLDALGLSIPVWWPSPVAVAYHDACHLSHGQGVRLAPRRLLQQIDNVTVVEVPDGDMCCGSAGLYNVEHPDAAAKLGGLKGAAVAATGARLVAAGNIGCITQIGAYSAVPVHHTIELLDLASRSGR